jgi:hypothetical protein
MTPEDGTDRLFRNLGNHSSACLAHIPEERMPQLHRDGRVKNFFQSLYRNKKEGRFVAISDTALGNFAPLL